MDTASLPHKFLLAGCLLSVLAACDHSTTKPAAGPESNDTARLPQIQIGRPEQVHISEPILATGSVFAHKTTNIVPLVGGLIEEIRVNVGDRVDQGAPLIRLRQAEFDLSVKRLAYARDLAKSELEDALRNWDNANRLREREVISQETLDALETRVAVSTSKLGMAEVNLSLAQQELTDSIVKAPFRGVITKRFVDEGAFVPSVMRSESPVVQLQKIDIVIVQIFVPETYLTSVSPGMRAIVHIPSLGQTFESRVALINDNHELNTRNIELRIGIANPDYVIKPGLFAVVKLYPEAREIRILPPESLLGAGQDRHVLTVEDGKVQRMNVAVKALTDGSLELLSELDPDTNIIVGTQRHTLEPGNPVTVDQLL